jgi:hypothetical protein
MDPSTLKLPQRLDLETNRKIIKQYRNWETVQKKIASFENHLHFTLHCKHHGVIPPSLTLKCSMKGRNTVLILNRAQKALTNERVNQIKVKLQGLKSERADFDEFLFSKLPSDTYAEIKIWMNTAHERQFNNIRVKQKRKFQRLLERKNDKEKERNAPISNVSSEDRDQIQSKWVVNLSNYTISKDEESILRKGLNFAVTPKKIPMEEYVIGIESVCRFLGPDSKEAQTLRSDCVRILKNSPPLKSNISRAEKVALDSLAKNNEITIVPADKGRSVVVMNTRDYKTKAKNILADRQTYELLGKDPTPKFTSTLVGLLQECKKEDISGRQRLSSPIPHLGSDP